MDLLTPILFARLLFLLNMQICQINSIKNKILINSTQDDLAEAPDLFSPIDFEFLPLNEISTIKIKRRQIIIENIDGSGHTVPTTTIRTELNFLSTTSSIVAISFNSSRITPIATSNLVTSSTTTSSRVTIYWQRVLIWSIFIWSIWVS
jgi:hypothetical protein